MGRPRTQAGDSVFQRMVIGVSSFGIIAPASHPYFLRVFQLPGAQPRPQAGSTARLSVDDAGDDLEGVLGQALGAKQALQLHQDEGLAT